MKSSTEKDMAELEQIVELMQNLANHNMHTGFCEADMHFHEVMVRSAHSPHLMDVYHRANFPLTLTPPQPRENTLQRDAKQHLNILNALQKRDFSLLVKRLVEGYAKL